MSAQQWRAAPFKRPRGASNPKPYRLNGTSRSQACRIVLYSHDTMGVGHGRRNLLIAQALAEAPFRTAIFLIAGASEIRSFAVPNGVDSLTLPSLYKEADGSYRSRCWPIPLRQMIDVRARTILAAVEAFDPDVVLVDKEPQGALGELGPALDFLRRRGRACCLLGLRDVLDDPETVRREWDAAGHEDAIRAYYDHVWIYGDPSVYDPVREYGFSAEVAAKVSYTGYLDQCMRLDQVRAEDREALAETLGRPGRLLLCTVGGGQDGASLAEAFSLARFPPDAFAVIVAGPCMPREVVQRLQRRAAHHSRLEVLEFVAEANLLLKRADRVVTMGGYNSVCAAMGFEKPALIVPRVSPRREQLIRAEALRALGLVDVLRPEALTPGALSEWLGRDLGPRPSARERIDLAGAARLPQLLSAALAVPAVPAVPSYSH